MCLLVSILTRLMPVCSHTNNELNCYFLGLPISIISPELTPQLRVLASIEELGGERKLVSPKCEHCSQGNL